MECCRNPYAVCISNSSKKGMNKTNQYLSEAFGLSRGTGYDDDFLSKKLLVERRMKLSESLALKTRKLLYPNDFVNRLKINSLTGSKGFRPKVKLPETSLGDFLLLGAQELGAASFTPDDLSHLLYDTGVAFKNLAILRDKLIDDVTILVIRPQAELLKDYVQLTNLRKKLENRRLDYDCRKRKHEAKNATVTEEELRLAERKFKDIKEMTEGAMLDYIKKDNQRAATIRSLTGALLNYHRQAAEVLEQMYNSADERPMSNGNGQGIHIRRSEHHLSSVISEGYGRSRVLSSRDIVFVEETQSEANQQERNQPLEAPVSPVPETEDDSAISSKQEGVEFFEATQDYSFEDDNGTGKNALFFEKGEILETIGHSADANWVLVRNINNGQTGYAPTSYIKKHSISSPPPSSPPSVTQPTVTPPPPPPSSQSPSAKADDKDKDVAMVNPIVEQEEDDERKPTDDGPETDNKKTEVNRRESSDGDDVQKDASQGKNGEKNGHTDSAKERQETD